MRHKQYQRLTTKVVELRHRGMLMASGDKRQTTLQSYNWREDVIEE